MLLLLGVCRIYGQTTFDTCQAEGSAQRANIRTQNLKKNRDGAPTDAQINKAITFSILLSSNENSTLFTEGDGAEITAYVADVKIGAIETCNCRQKDHWHRDTHIELTIDPLNSGDKSQLLVAEVTPRVRQAMKDRGIDWSNRALRDTYLGRWVTIRGWVFYDASHSDESAGSGGSRIWRGSAWEIHPVTSIELTHDSTHHSYTQPSSGALQCTGNTKSGKRCLRTTTNKSQTCWQHTR